MKHYKVLIIIIAILVVLFLVEVGVVIYVRIVSVGDKQVNQVERQPIISKSISVTEEVIKKIVPFDCGTDENCYYQQLKSCSVSTVKTPISPFKLRFQLDIKGEEDNKCLIYISTIENPEKYPQLKNAEMNCKFPKGTVKGSSGMPIDKTGCSGSLLNLLLVQDEITFAIALTLNWGNLKIETKIP